MNFSTLDYIIVFSYLIAIALFGIISSGKQKNVNDYFLGSKKIPWWAVCVSIVATETSTLTFISIPGLAYLTNMNFLQLAFGYLIGRIVVAFVFIPRYYKGQIETAYQFLGNRFGNPMRRYASVTFILLRIFADGVRLFITAIPIKFITGWGYFECILIVGIVTLIYSYIGGVKAVVWTDVAQMFIYMFAAFASILIIYKLIPGGWSSIFNFAFEKGKFEIFNLNFTSFKEFFTGKYNLIGGLIGGAFLSMASHGTDQLIVQRLLTCKDKNSSQKALITSGIIIIIQFFIFLFIGVMLYVLYNGIDFQKLSIGNYYLTKSDEIFPKFIIENHPVGISGLVVAGLLSASMSTLSSAFNSLSATTVMDLFRKYIGDDSKKQLFYSRIATLFWGIVIIGTSLLFQDEKNPAVDFALKIQSIIYGGLLGVFILGIINKSANLLCANISYTFTIIILVLLFILPQFNLIPALNLTFFTLFGVIICLLIGYISTIFIDNKRNSVET
ncbi:MAG: sodium:solute symporter [Ignavibacteria bacterium]|nr:sodium:solute symporter [Ignavibacteria bacterium]